MWCSALGLGSFWSVCAVGPAPIKLNSGPEGFQEPGHTQGCSERVQDATESSSFCSVPREGWTARGVTAAFGWSLVVRTDTPYPEACLPVGGLTAPKPPEDIWLICVLQRLKSPLCMAPGSAPTWRQQAEVQTALCGHQLDWDEARAPSPASDVTCHSLSAHRCNGNRSPAS